MLFKRCASLCSSLWRRVSHIALSRGISKALRNIGLCLLVVSLLTLSPLFSSSVSAIELSSTGLIGDSTIIVETSNAGSFSCSVTNTSLNDRWCRVGIPTSATSRLSGIVINYSDGINNQMSLFSLVLRFSFVGASTGKTASLVGLVGSAGNAVLDQKIVWFDDNYATITALVYAQNDGSLRLGFRNEMSMSLPTTIEYNVPSFIHLKSSADYSGDLSNINSSIQSVTNKLDGVISGVGGVQSSVNSAADQAHQDSQAEIDAINEQTQQQQDQYEQEKEEENQREDELDGQASQAESMFSFTFLNPFIGIFELFNDSGCVAIPTIAGMVGSDETTYCPWFDSSVRNILTPVIGLSSMILLFGFVIYWLRGDSSDILYKGRK